MAGRYDFQSRFGRSDDVWFTVGSIGVNTTTGLLGIGVFGILLARIVPSSVRALALTSEALSGLQLWRLVTWIIPNGGDGLFWTAILLYMLFTFGSQLESQIGRHKMLRLVLALTLVPAFAFALVALSTGGGIYGLNTVELGLLVAFAAQFPWVRFFFGIPAPVMVGIFVVFQMVQWMRFPAGLVLLIVTVLMALFGIRSMGYADDLHQVPRIPIPGLGSGNGAGNRTRSTPRWGNRSRGTSTSTGRASSARKSTHLRAVPTDAKSTSPPASPPEIDAILDQINDSGYDSLSDSQKAMLKNYSNRLRKDRDS